MKLNLGCGYNKLDGYANVDSDPNCQPDVLADLEDSLPFEDNSVDEIVLNHVLEHLGQTTKVYFHVWKEMYRVLKDGALVLITVPHHNHDNFHHDATHVRKITPLGIDMFNQQRNTQTIESGGQESTLGLQIGVDVAVMDVGYDLTPWFNEHVQGKPREFAELEMNKYNNTCFQVHIKAKAFKPARSQR